MDEEKVRHWLESGGYGLLRAASGGYLVTASGTAQGKPPQIVYLPVSPMVLNDGTSLERLVVDVSEQIPELGGPPSD